MGKVVLKDYEVLACHGVNEDEKVHPQRFLFTIDMDIDISPAAMDDDIEKTVSYSAVKKSVKKFAEENCFNLIETLADRTALELLLQYSLLDGVTVTVKKPDAPMSGNFDYVSASTSRSWHTAYLSLGSSIGDKNQSLDFAIARLKEKKFIRFVSESKRYSTEPYGGVAENEFLNSAAKVITCLSPLELLAVVNKIESDGGRVRDKHWGDRTLDIDIIFFDDVVMDTPRLTIPHPDMQNRRFVLEPLYELCPNKVHPVYRMTVTDLFAALPSPLKNR